MSEYSMLNGYYYYTCRNCGARFHCAVKCEPMCDECTRKSCTHDLNRVTSRGWCEKCGAKPHQVIATLHDELTKARSECEKLKFDMQFKLDVLREALRDLESSASDTEPEYPTSDNHDDYYTAGYELALFEVSKVARRALRGGGE